MSLDWYQLYDPLCHGGEGHGQGRSNIDLDVISIDFHLLNMQDRHFEKLCLFCFW